MSGKALGGSRRVRGVRRVHRGGSSGALPIVGVMSGTNRVDVAGAASIGSGGG